MLGRHGRRAPGTLPGADGGGLVVGLGRQGVGDLAQRSDRALVDHARAEQGLDGARRLRRRQPLEEAQRRANALVDVDAGLGEARSDAVQGVGQGREGAGRRAGNGVEPLHGPFQASEPLLDAFEYRDQGRFGRAVLRGGRCAESRKVGHGASSGFACGQQRATLRGTSSATRVPVQRGGISRRPAGTAAFQLKR